MSLIALVDLLAQLPETNLYLNPWKLASMVVVFAVWALFAQWVDKDTVAVNTFRVLWNLTVISSGAPAAAVLVLVPNYWIGLLLFLVINGTVLIVYVLHRNKLVPQDDKVFTPAHIRGVLARVLTGKKKKVVKEVMERVQLRAHDGRVVRIPGEETEREQYRVTQDMLFDALWRRAALVEVTPAGQNSRIVYTIDGLPAERDALPRTEGEAIVWYLKSLAGLSHEERRKPQKGTIRAAIGDNKLDVVVQTTGSAVGEKLVLRVVGGEAKYKIEDLGFTPKQFETIKAVMHEPRGLVLISGPAGSGVTTTIYSVARSHDAFLQNIQTLEYERELELHNVTQHVFVPSDDKTFQGELQKLVRSDPDIVVLPEIRERPAAAMAAQAATQKQKVYVALGGADLFEALHKWMTTVGDGKLVAKSVLAVLNQRLVRKLCGECKQPYKPDAQTLRKISLPSDKVLHRPPEPQFDKQGRPIICQNCQGSGFYGRTGVFDILLLDDGLREIIRSGGSMRDIQSYALKKGGLGLQQHALQKVFDGVTSIQEVVRATRGQKPAAPAPPKPPAAVATQPAPKPQRGSAG